MIDFRPRNEDRGKSEAARLVEKQLTVLPAILKMLVTIMIKKAAADARQCTLSQYIAVPNPASKSVRSCRCVDNS